MAFFRKLFALINKIIPKRNIIIFNSFPAFSDNAFPVYDYIYNNRPDVKKKYNLIWSIEKNIIVPKLISDRKDTLLIYKHSLRGYWGFLRAKYIIYTHGYFMEVTSGRNQKQINLWHGVGFKAHQKGFGTFYGDYTIATSPIYQDVQGEALNIKKENVWVTGLPKEDVLFSQGCALEKLGIDKNHFHKIFIWMPTYRASNSKFGSDGNDKSFNIHNFSYEEINKLNDILISSNSLMIVKPHPYDLADFSICFGFSNIKLIDNECLRKHNVQLNELLTETDCLLSDYSSVVVDYLLLDKPIALVMSDIEEYKNSRGFVFDDISSYFVGPVLSNIDELFSYIENSEDLDKKWEPKRKEITNEFHTYHDGKSAQRVVERIFGKMEEQS